MVNFLVWTAGCLGSENMGLTFLYCFLIFRQLIFNVCHVLLSTSSLSSSSGSDSYTPKSDEAKLFCIFYCTLGIPLTLFLLTLLSNLLLPVITHAPVHHLHAYWGLPYTRAALVHATLLSGLVLFLLFLLPALLVCVLEPDWSFLDALFFCFLTLSTVGQGGNTLGRAWSPTAKETLELLTTCKWNGVLESYVSQV